MLTEKIISIRNARNRLLFTSGKVKLAAAAIKERYVRWQLQRALKHPGRATPPEIPVREDIVLSLTSWEKRLDVLPLALYCLVHQSVRPARMEVWLTEDDLNLLPGNVRTLFSNYGVRFRTCEDYRSHKKWLPALREEQDRFVVTADDDTLYPRHWLRWLLRDFDPSKGVSVAHRCKQIVFDEEGRLRPYDMWVEARDVPVDKVSKTYFAIGIGGRILHRDWIPKAFMDPARILKISPKSDDVWLGFALAYAGIPTKNSGTYLPFLEVADTYASSLQHFNNERGLKDVQMSKTMEAFDLGPEIFRDEEAPRVMQT